MNMIELLAPAGSPEALDAAIGAGADAVYFGLKNFNARIRSTNFTYAQMEAAVRSLHRLGRKCYITVNTVFEQREADRIFQLLKYLSSIGPDGIIVQDFGIVNMVKRYFPSLKLHASTQMNIASSRGANALSKDGVSRVVLARELCIDEIRAIRAGTNTELEVFVHGALCISESGLCLFSSYLGGKSANRGMCTQACRRFYRCTDIQRNQLGTDDQIEQSEKLDHAEFDANSDTESGYFFSPSDLQLIEKIPYLVEAGVNAFKIEGRMKSADYVGTVVSAYRRVIDAVIDNGAIYSDKLTGVITKSVDILRNDFARTKTLFHFNRDADVDWLNPDNSGGTGIALGKIIKVRGTNETRQGLIANNAKISLGDSIRIHSADDSNRQTHKVTFAEKTTINGGTEDGIWVSIPQANIGDSVFLIQTKAMSRHYPAVLPKNTETFHREPGHEKAPEIALTRPSKKTSQQLRDGLYTAVSRINDLYAVQSVRPVQVLLSYNRKNAAHILSGKVIPFPSSEIILVLDPYFPQDLDVISNEIPLLLEKGFCKFVVNNPGHFSLFRGTDATLIAGPYLYMFNRFSASLVAEMGGEFFVPPLENNRQNLERTFDPSVRSSVFVTIFAYPALFRIRTDLSKVYGSSVGHNITGRSITHFSDSRGEEFSLLADIGESLVIPERPFSIVDKIPFLQEAGFRRFILDFSGPALKKKYYKDVMKAAKSGICLPDISRFNWKDGFFQLT
jgi:putative protease